MNESAPKTAVTFPRTVTTFPVFIFLASAMVVCAERRCGSSRKIRNKNFMHEDVRIIADTLSENLTGFCGRSSPTVIASQPMERSHHDEGDAIRCTENRTFHKG